VAIKAGSIGLFFVVVVVDVEVFNGAAVAVEILDDKVETTDNADAADGIAAAGAAVANVAATVDADAVGVDKSGDSKSGSDGVGVVFSVVVDDADFNFAVFMRNLRTALE